MHLFTRLSRPDLSSGRCAGQAGMVVLVILCRQLTTALIERAHRSPGGADGGACTGRRRTPWQRRRDPATAGAPPRARLGSVGEGPTLASWLTEDLCRACSICCDGHSGGVSGTQWNLASAIHMPGGWTRRGCSPVSPRAMPWWRIEDGGWIHLSLFGGRLPILGQSPYILAVGAPAQHVHCPGECLCTPSQPAVRACRQTDHP